MLKHYTESTRVGYLLLLIRISDLVMFAAPQLALLLRCYVFCPHFLAIFCLELSDEAWVPRKREVDVQNCLSSHCETKCIVDLPELACNAKIFAVSH